MQTTAAGKMDAFVVRGRVSVDGRHAVGRLTLCLYLRNVGGDRQAGGATTDHAGQYRIDVPAKGLHLTPNSTVDWVVRVFAGTELLHISSVRYNARADETINIELPADTPGLPAEYEVLTAALTDFFDYPRRLAEHLSGDTLLASFSQSPDIDYIAGKTGWPVGTLKTKVRADEASALRGSKVGADLLYALYRTGQTEDWRVLCRHDEASLRRAWQQAVDKKLIAQPSGASVDAAIAALHEMYADQLLKTPSRDGGATLEDMLALSGLAAAQAASFSRLLATHRHDTQALWEKVGKEFGITVTERLRINRDLAKLTQDNLPLMAKLVNSGGTYQLTLAGMHRAEKWLSLLTDDVALPANFSGDKVEVRRSAYAGELAARLRSLHPTAAIAELVRSRDLAVDGHDAVADFLTRQDREFDLHSHPVERFVAETQVSVAPAVLGQVKRLQRVYQLTRSDQSAVAMLQPGSRMDSAAAIVGLGRSEFVRKLTTAQGGDTQSAEGIFDRAVQIHATTLNVAVSYITARQAPVLGLTQANGSPARLMQPADSAAFSPSGVIPYATLEALFGSVDYGSFDPSRTVLSPAAYLVDLLDFIQGPAQDELFRRRPDIQHLKLDGGNTTTPLPAIDLTNETLEYFVAKDAYPYLDGYAGHDTGNADSDDLIATPQNTADATYARLQQECFPSPLPFHLPLETVRRHFAQAGVPLAKVMSQLRTTAALEASAGAYGWRDILTEELEISPPEHRILTDSSLTLNQLFGFDPAADSTSVLGELSNAKAFCHRVGVSYEELAELLGTRFINPNLVLMPKLIRLGVPFGTIQALNNGQLSDDEFLALLPPGAAAPDPTRYDGDIAAWVRGHYAQIASILTLQRVSPGSAVDFSDFQITYAINPALINADFDSPAVASGVASQAISGWTINGNAGVQNYSANWGNALPAPSGTQTAFIQMGSSIAQTLAIDQGSYRLWVQLGSPIVDPSVDASVLSVTVDDTLAAGTMEVPRAMFQRASFPFSVGSAGLHTLRLIGDDNTAGLFFVDAATLAKVPEPSVFLRLIRFIRLWKKTGWTIEQTDQAICALFKADLSALSAEDVETAAQLDAGFKVLMPRLGVVKRTMDALALEADTDLLPLLACWSDISTFGASSLYRQTFLSPTVLKLDGVFDDDGFGEVLNDASQTVQMHEKALCGALELSQDDFLRICDRLGLAGAPLNLANLSALYRHVWLAAKLSITVQDFFLLTFFTKLNPFEAPDIATGSTGVNSVLDILPSDEPPISRLIGWAKLLQSLSLEIAGLLTLVGDIDRDGNSLPQFSERGYHELIRTVRADFVAIDQQFAITAGSPDESVAARIDLAFGQGVGARFVELVTNTAVFTVSYAHSQPDLEAAILAAAPNLLYDDGQHRLLHRGRMSAIQLNALNAITGLPDTFMPAVGALFDLGAASYPLFSSHYPDLVSLSNAYGSGGSDAEKWAAVQASFDTVVVRPRKREKALERIAAFVGTDLASVRALLDSGPYVNHPAPLVDSVDTVVDAYLVQGLQAEFFYAPTAAGAPSTQDNQASNLDYSLGGGNPLPHNPAAPGASISSRWTGWIEAPEAGYLTLCIDTDAGANLTLTLDGSAQAMTNAGTSWISGALPASAGQLCFLVLTVENIHDRMALTWQTPSRAREPIPGRFLYPGRSNTWLFANLLLHTGNAIKLAQAVGVTATEIAHLSTMPEGLIARPADPSGGTGWLNFVPNYFDSTWSVAPNVLPRCLRALLEYVRMKASWAPKTEGLLAVLQNPVAATGATDGLFFRMSGASSESLQATLAHVGRGPADLSGLGLLRYAFDSLTLIRRLGMTAVPVLGAATNDPGVDAVAALLQEVRANANAASWRARVRPINDELRVLRRDALVAFILKTFSLNPGFAHIDTPDKLFEYFLADVAMEPGSQTSRIRHALSSVQLFIERCMMNLEPNVPVSAFDQGHRDQWTWMKRYRVWEAQRRLFIYPENWLEPELRDDKSSFYKDMESELLQSDITDPAAEQAVLNYLSKLHDVSRLEPCGIFVDGPSTGTSSGVNTVHLIAKTFGANRSYYYRQYEMSGAWTPWQMVNLDIPDVPVIPVVWNQRLMLFWLRLLSSVATAPAQAPDTLPTGKLTELTLTQVYGAATAQAGGSQSASMNAVLCWSSFNNGSWEKPRTSSIDSPLHIAQGPFDRIGKLASSSIELFTPAFGVWERGEHDPLRIGVYADFQGSYGLAKTNSLPVHSNGALVWNRWQSGYWVRSLAGGQLEYAWYILPGSDINGDFGDSAAVALLNIPPGETAKFIQHGNGYSDHFGHDRWAGFWDTPFLYQDGQCIFFVETRAIPAADPDNNFPSSITYDFRNLYHPFVDNIVEAVLAGSLASIYSGVWQDSLKGPPGLFNQRYRTPTPVVQAPGYVIDVTFPPHDEMLETDPSDPYALYNWELFFHAPVTVAVHLSKTRRFAEAQRWFHFVFNPVSTADEDAPKRYWNFTAFRSAERADRIEDLLVLLSTPVDKLDATQQRKRDRVLTGYADALKHPFQPHAVARTRLVAYQYHVVMKYLDNLLAWGDDLFRQDTVETVNEATQIYVLAANILGPRPQRIPQSGAVQARSYAEIKLGVDAMGNALVELENTFPFNQPANDGAQGSMPSAGPLLGIGSTLYFSVPPNDKLLSYWDQVADRLSKVRHGMNIDGVVRALAMFDPPIDPGLLVAAAGAGFDISSILSGLTQPIGPWRALSQIQSAIALANEVKALGGALLGAIEKGDAERLALVRQGHEIKIQKMARETRFLQWKATEESTTSLVKARSAIRQRLQYYKRLLGLPDDPNAPEELEIQRPEQVTEANFADALNALVTQYDKPLTLLDLPPMRLQETSSPLVVLGGAGAGRLYLNVHEDLDLNILSPAAHALRELASANDTASKLLALIPDITLDLQYWGLGADTKVFGGSFLANVAQMVSSALNTGALISESQAAQASKTATFERRADEWIHQHNQVANDLMQNGRQIISALLAEQVSRHDYEMADQQLVNAGEIKDLLENKFTNQEMYQWMQTESSRLYYEYYRFAYEIARRAENAMKQELMRPELDSQTFVQFNYWDTGRKGLLAGEALLLDLKRMELAYHDNNKRELEITKHISLRQLNALELLNLRENGRCAISVPDEIYALDFPSHYFRRIKSVSVSLPCVVGPYTSVSGTLGLGGSKLRAHPAGDAAPVGPVAVQAIATSTASNDSGLFEFNFRDERYLPFEGAGAAADWTFTLPHDFKAFDYSTISDLILHVRYTARDGGEPAAAAAITRVNSWLKTQKDAGPLCLLLSLRQDFPLAWSALKQDVSTAKLKTTVELSDDLFPYFTRGMTRKFGSPATHSVLNEPDSVEVTSSITDAQLMIDVANAQNLDRLTDIFVAIPYAAVL